MALENYNLREEAAENLSFHLKNPGYFSILVLGESGTGKKYIIDQLLFEKIKSDTKKEFENLDELNLRNVIERRMDEKYGFYNAFEIGETECEIEKIFSKDIILIENIEELNDKQQNVLFKFLSTDSDGEIGLGKNKGLKRIIFTSTYDVKELRDSKNNLNDRFWDRISQLVVKLPSFKDYSSNIRKDFESVWKKMDFKEFDKLPTDGEFDYWLTENCGKFAGNFRDLDKIAILWHQYRIIEYSNKEQKFKSDVEARIFRKVRSDFEKFTHFPTQKSDTTNIYEFKKAKHGSRLKETLNQNLKYGQKLNMERLRMQLKR